MKQVFILMSVVFGSTLGFGASLEDAYRSQLVEKFEPITIEGSSVTVDANFPQSFQNAATVVCASLGYVRLVHYELEPCKSGEKFVYIEMLQTTAASVHPVEHENSGCLWDWTEKGKFKSVTCAR